MINKTRLLLFLIPFVCIGQGITSERQKELERKRVKLQQEIQRINTVLFSNLQERKTVISRVEDIEVKMKVRGEIIDVNNQQIKLLEKRIVANQKSIEQFQKELEEVKKNYAEIIRKSHQSKSLQNRLMFLFSSQNFWQAYKRVEYMKQYNAYRKQQAREIVDKGRLLKALNQTLLTEKTKKENLIAQNKQVEVALKRERSLQRKMIRDLGKEQKALAQKIKEKQKEADRIDKEIERIIREAIAASNKASNSSNANRFFLTPEAKLNGQNFLANKGRLPWPVKQGVVIQNFGVQPHAIVKTAIINNTGITIATQPEAAIRAVFEGTVMAVFKFSGSNPTVLVQHGNYVTAYKNLGKVFVKKGDRVTVKQAIGETFTNKQTGKTSFQFAIFVQSKPQNPKGWLYEL